MPKVLTEEEKARQAELQVEKEMIARELREMRDMGKQAVSLCVCVSVCRWLPRHWTKGTNVGPASLPVIAQCCGTCSLFLLLNASE